MAIVLDASAALSIVRRDEDGPAIKELVLDGEDIIAPDLFQLEIASALWKYVRAGYHNNKSAAAYYEAACALSTRFVRQNDLVPEVLLEAIHLEHSVYEIAYLVLARRLNASLASLDCKLINLCAQQGIDCISAIAL